MMHIEKQAKVIAEGVGMAGVKLDALFNIVNDNPRLHVPDAVIEQLREIKGHVDAVRAVIFDSEGN